MNEKIKSIYEILLETYNEQGWWPLGVTKNSAPIYDKSYKEKKLSYEQKWEMIVGSILTQNTNWNNVVTALMKLSNP